MKRIITSLTLFILPFYVLAQNKAYSIFNPVPQDSVREEMETDRPNVTETPYTVDAGHVQYEASIVNLERKQTEKGLQRTWLINHGNLKIGLLPNTSLHVIFESYGVQTMFEKGMPSMSTHGFGDLTLRLKQSLYGNCQGNFSIALMPYVTFPTNRYSDNRLYETGLMIPATVKLPNDWKLGFQVEADYLRNDEEPGRHGELMQSLVLSKVLFDKLEIMGETYYAYDVKHHLMHNYVDTALQYALSKDLKIDAGINHGLQKDAGDNYFIGVAFRH